jgi:hypothetical protein
MIIPCHHKGKFFGSRTVSKIIFKNLELIQLVKCYIWSVALYGAATWTLRAADQKYLESFEMWCWIRMEKISWTDHVRNENVLLRVNEQRKTYMK